MSYTPISTLSPEETLDSTLVSTCTQADAAETKNYDLLKNKEAFKPTRKADNQELRTIGTPKLSEKCVIPKYTHRASSSQPQTQSVES